MKSKIFTHAQGVQVLYNILLDKGMSPARIETKTGILPMRMASQDMRLPLECFISL